VSGRTLFGAWSRAMVSAGVLSAGAACGGGQQALPEVPRGADAEPVVDAPAQRGPTPEELEAQRQASAEQAFVRAVEMYRAAPEGERDLAAIERLFEQARDHETLSRDARFNLAVIAMERGDLPGATTAFRALTDEDPTFAAGLANIGYIQMMRQDFAGARSTFDECLARRDTEPGCNINLALLYALGQAPLPVGTNATSAQIERLRFALGGDGANADAYARLSKIYYEQGQLQLARLVCENAVLLGIDEAVLHNRLGLIELRENNVIAAYREFQRAVELDPGMTAAWVNVGAMAMSFRDYEVAVTSFERVVRLRPDDHEARLSYGAALRGIDDLDGARREYEAVLSARSNDPGALFNLALLEQEGRQNYPEACRYYVRYLGVAGAHPRVDDARRRLTNLRSLLDSLVFLGEAAPEDAAACSL